MGSEGRVKGGGGGGMATRRGHHRVLHFKDVNAQLAYNAQYGTDDMWMSVMNHIQSMSRDIAIMREMGPKPDDFVANANMRKPLDAHTQAMFDVMLGRTAMTGSESDAYKVFKGTAAWLRGAQLGSAVVPAISDAYWAKSAAKIAGIPYADVLSAYGGKLDDIEANIYAIEATTGNLLHKVWDGESLITTSKTKAEKFMAVGQNVSGFTMRVSLLQKWTQFGKDSVTIAYNANTAKMAKLPWDKLPEDYREFIQTHGGFNAEDWAKMAKAQANPIEGRNFSMLYPSDVAKVDVNVAVKYEAVIQRLRKLATNEPDLKTKAVTTGGQESGTLGRAMRDSAFMYRSFPITVLNNHIRANITKTYMKEGGASAATDLAMMLMATTALGYLVLNMGDVVKGKEPRIVSRGLDKGWDDVKMAAITGGGFSVLADFVIGDVTRYGNSFAESIAGPPVAFAGDVYRLGRGQAMDAVFGESLFEMESGQWEEKFGINASKMIQRYMPAGNLWYTRAALDATLFDGLERYWGGSEYYRAKAREARRLQQEGAQKLEIFE
jgi:hypothetical protein